MDYTVHNFGPNLSVFRLHTTPNLAAVPRTESSPYSTTARDSLLILESYRA